MARLSDLDTDIESSESRQNIGPVDGEKVAQGKRQVKAVHKSDGCCHQYQKAAAPAPKRRQACHQDRGRYGDLDAGLEPGHVRHKSEEAGSQGDGVSEREAGNTLRQRADARRTYDHAGDEQNMVYARKDVVNSPADERSYAFERNEIKSASN
jgi:hypothetical protein